MSLLKWKVRGGCLKWDGVGIRVFEWMVRRMLKDEVWPLKFFFREI